MVITSSPLFTSPLAKALKIILNRLPASAAVDYNLLSLDEDDIAGTIAPIILKILKGSIMPSYPDVTISDQHFSDYPKLKLYLDADPSDCALFSPISKTTKHSYSLFLSDSHLYGLRIIDIYSLYGKMSHLKALPLNGEVIKANNYNAIRCAAINGHLETIEYLFTYLNYHEKIAAIKASDRVTAPFKDSYMAIKNAASNGHLATIVYFFTYLNDDEKNEAVKADTLEFVTTNSKLNFYGAISSAAENGHITIIKYLFTYLSDKEKKEAARNYSAIKSAAKNGHFETVEYLFAYLNDMEKKEAIKGYFLRSHGLILLATKTGDITTIRYLLSHLSNHEKKAVIKEGIHAYDKYEVIKNAAENGHITVIQEFETYLSVTEQKEAVKADYYGAIIRAAANGHLATIKYLLRNLSDNEKREALIGLEYSAVRTAAAKGYMETVQYIESYLNDHEKKEAVKAIGYNVIREAAGKGLNATIEHLLTHLNDDEQREAIKSCDYSAIRGAIYYGRDATIEYLLTYLNDDEKKEAAKTQSYWVIRCALRECSITTTQSFLNHLNADEKNEAIRELDYAMMESAVEQGNTEIIQEFETYLSVAEVNEVIKANDYKLIRKADEIGCSSLMQHFLNKDAAFAYCESNDFEYGEEYVYPFITHRLNLLKSQKAIIEHEEPQGIFDIEEEEGTLCFYILRNLIRRGVARVDFVAEDHVEEIDFLLSIPRVRALCHQRINDGQENELYQLALDLENGTAAALLMQLPEVRRIAYTQAQLEDDLNLRDISQNRELSIVPVLNETRASVTIPNRNLFFQDAPISNLDPTQNTQIDNLANRAEF